MVVGRDHSATRSSANVVLLKYLALVLCCFDFFFFKKIYLIRNLARENLGNEAYRSGCGFAP